MSKIKIRKGVRRPRVKRPIEKDLVVGYDSKWEYQLHTGMLSDWKIHENTVQYVVEHKYTPDFIRTIDDKVILLEAKGRFWDHAEYTKYIWINKALPQNHELVFLFLDPYAPMPQAKRRKDGTRRTHAEWAEANDFRWFSETTIPDSWINIEFKDEGLC